MKKTDRRNQILAAALQVARRIGYHAVTRDTVAQEANIAVGLLYRHFTGMDDLKHHIMLEAIRQRALTVLAQGLALGDRTAQEAPEELRALAAVRLGGEV